MRVSRKILALSALFMSLVLLSSHNLMAIGEEAPIIALANNNIYLVSPTDGDARLVVERDPEKDALIAEKFGTASLKLSPISPDNTKFAYVAPLYEVLDPAFEDKQREIANLHPRDITLVDIASGALTPITDQGANFAEAVENDKLTNFSHLTWSIDGQRLYYLASVLSLRNRVPQRRIEYYDLASGERQVLAKLSPQAELIGLYPVHPGVVALTRPPNQTDFDFTLYDPDGFMLNLIKMPLPGSMDCTNGTLFDMNPVFHEDRYYYGYYPHKTSEVIPALLDTALEDTSLLSEDQYPTIISRTNPDTSLRVVYTGMCDYNLSTRWMIADVEDNVTNYPPLMGVSHLFEMALSPDGALLAILDPNRDNVSDLAPITIIDADGIRELDFVANQIRWGAIDFTFTSVILHG